MYVVVQNWVILWILQIRFVPSFRTKYGSRWIRRGSLIITLCRLKGHPPQTSWTWPELVRSFFHFRGISPHCSTHKCLQMSLVVYRCAQSTIKQYKIIELSLKNGTWRHDQRYLNSSLPRQCFIESLPLLCCFFTEVKSCKTCHNWCVIMLHCEP